MTSPLKPPPVRGPVLPAPAPHLTKDGCCSDCSVQACWLAEVSLRSARSVMPCCGMSRASATATGGNTHLRPAAVALALGATICRLQVMSASLIGHSGSSAFRLIHHYSVDVAHGLVLLYEIGTRAVPSWDSKTRWNNLSGGLVVSVTTGPSGACELTSSIVPQGTSFHRSVGLNFPSIGFDPARFSCCCRGLFPGRAEFGASTHMRCIITANRRARATIAFFIPRRLAICIAQALSQDHFFDRSML